jgi:DNA repair ATPase RecN
MTADIRIERLIVEEGFLDGLDLSFSRGLNVLIGPRGVGKTSVIQLLRYCLGAEPLSERARAAARNHALEVLGEDGRVTAAMTVNGERLILSRRSRDAEPDAHEHLPVPIVLAQAEVEDIGLDPEGKLRLIDGFRSGPSGANDRQRAAQSRVKSLTVEAKQLQTAISKSQMSIASLEDLRAQLKAAEDELAKSERTAAGVVSELQKLNELGELIAAGGVRESVLGRTGDALNDWLTEVANVHRRAPSIEEWPGEGEKDPLGPIRAKVEEASSQLEAARIAVENSAEQARELRATEASAVRAWQDEARTLRRTVEQVQSGTGSSVRRVGALREQVAQLEAESQALSERRHRLDATKELRRSALEEVDGARDDRYKERIAVADSLNRSLEPRIQVAIERSGLFDGYADAIADLLRGSGLHARDVAPRIAESMSPVELVNAVEQDDATSVSKAGGIQDDRARRIIDRIAEAGPESLIAADVEDRVRLYLKDGRRLKPTEELSTGQRCTVILPILLRHQDRPLIIDQPEDHLDGAFVVETLVRAIVGRGESQLIVATHNPNIPVLGEASQVTLLGSDGQRGFEVHTDELEAHQTIEAITSLMEGGREAFQRRAAFYDSE